MRKCLLRNLVAHPLDPLFRQHKSCGKAKTSSSKQKKNFRGAETKQSFIPQVISHFIVVCLIDDDMTSIKGESYKCIFITVQTLAGNNSVTKIWVGTKLRIPSRILGKFLKSFL